MTPKHVALFLVASLGAAPALAQDSPPSRIALVVGETAYPGQPLTTPANDAGLIAQGLQEAGFDVVGARDLDKAALEASIAEFVERAKASPPGTDAFVYVAGYGLQYDGADYVVPVGATLAQANDVPNETVAIGYMTSALAATSLGSITVVLDAAHANRFPLSGQPLASGLAVAHPDVRTILAFNAAPGTVAPNWDGTYGPYASALAETIREGGVPLEALFRRVRVKVANATNGDQVPWDAANGVPSVVLLPNADATSEARGAEFDRYSKSRIGELQPRDAFAVAIANDTLADYDAFLAAYPRDIMAPRVRVMAAVRREALAWRKVADRPSATAFQSYLARYPKGPHAGDASRGLRIVAAGQEAPAGFVADDGLVPSPPPDDLGVVDRPEVAFYDPSLDLPPPPPAPDWSVRYDPEDEFLSRPPAISDDYLLPVPFFVEAPNFRRGHRGDGRPDYGQVQGPRGVRTDGHRPRPVVTGTPPVLSRPRPVPNPASGRPDGNGTAPREAGETRGVGNNRPVGGPVSGSQPPAPQVPATVSPRYTSRDVAVPAAAPVTSGTSGTKVGDGKGRDGKGNGMAAPAAKPPTGARPDDAAPGIKDSAPIRVEKRDRGAPSVVPPNAIVAPRGASPLPVPETAPAATERPATTRRDVAPKVPTTRGSGTPTAPPLPTPAPSGHPSEAVERPRVTPNRVPVTPRIADPAYVVPETPRVVTPAPARLRPETTPIERPAVRQAPPVPPARLVPEPTEEPAYRAPTPRVTPQPTYRQQEYVRPTAPPTYQQQVPTYPQPAYQQPAYQQPAQTYQRQVQPQYVPQQPAYVPPQQTYQRQEPAYLAPQAPQQVAPQRLAPQAIQPQAVPETPVQQLPQSQAGVPTPFGGGRGFGR